ncbi:PaaI family thioesterase [Phreatobacter stygius]|uniref:PaaI family thioesterase n=1 Tax=Phreatobacter stygius TaxID=1940610 RepID=A0A4D7AZM5_9HYPH|nr:PaaI family thioesterase [Phreatobacter stygius]QCI63210.1 PaaI family thioesterase [Phreatobacter stygius]
MTAVADPIATLEMINRSAAFNRWAGFELIAAEPGKISLRMPWKAEVGQYSGFLHAGLIGAMIDTACGFAAAGLVGRVMASHFSVNCLSPAVGSAFVAEARVVRAGRRQIFTSAELFALQDDGQRKLVATGETILMVAEAPAAETGLPARP